MLDEILYLNPSRQVNNIGVNGYGTEADNMMIVAKRVKGKLDMMGLIKKIVLTEGLTLAQAIAESNAVGATIHLDMHSDAGGSRGCTGIFKSDKGKRLASLIYKYVSAVTPTSDRGVVYRDDLGCLNQTNAVAALIECFFHDNAWDVEFYESHVDNFAQAIVDGILEYLGINKTTTVVAAAPAQPASNLDAKVLWLQRQLNKLKFTDNNSQTLTEDGITGSRTRQAVMKLQNTLGLTVDGIVGDKTWRAIDEVLAKPVLRQGSIGKVVRYLQFRVGAGIDGSFGPATAAKVKTWQSVPDRGLTADGIVGSASWQKLIG